MDQAIKLGGQPSLSLRAFMSLKDDVTTRYECLQSFYFVDNQFIIALWRIQLSQVTFDLINSS